MRGVELIRGGRRPRAIGCQALVLACNGYGGNPSLFAVSFRRWRTRFISAIPEPRRRRDLGRGARRAALAPWRVSRPWFGRDPAQYLDHLGGDHAGRHSVNSEGRRFRENARLFRTGRRRAAPARRNRWNVFDACIAAGRQFEDFREAERGGAILTADTIAELARAMHVPAASSRRSATKLKPQGERGARSFRAKIRTRAAPGSPFCGSR